MSAAGYQNALSRMLADEHFRRWVREDAERALASYPLSSEEVRALRGLDPFRLAMEARSVHAGRRQLFFTAMPASVRQCISTEAAEQLAAIYATRFLERGMHPWRQSLLRYLLWLEGTEAASHGAPPTFTAMVRYERLRLALPPRRQREPEEPDEETRLLMASHAALVRFPVDLLAVFQHLDASPSETLSLPTQPHFFLLRQLEKGLSVEPASPLLLALLERCDGLRTVPELSSEVFKALPHVSVEQVVGLLEHLMRDGTLEGIRITRGPRRLPQPASRAAG